MLGTLLQPSNREGKHEQIVDGCSGELNFLLPKVSLWSRPLLPSKISFSPNAPNSSFPPGPAFSPSRYPLLLFAPCLLLQRDQSLLSFACPPLLLLQTGWLKQCLACGAERARGPLLTCPFHLPSAGCPKPEVRSGSKRRAWDGLGRRVEGGPFPGPDWLRPRT